VPSDDLGSIPDLQDKHHRVLAGKLKITTFRALARADRREIQRAMRNLRPRPTLEQIARWQDDARSRLSEATTNRSDWHPVASFAVVFKQRQVDDGWQHRIEVERTEVEPEEECRIWPDWDCGEICGWMRGQVPDETRPEPEPIQPAEPDAAPAVRERPGLRITRITVFGPASTAEGVTAGVAFTPLTGRKERPRIEISVRGGRRGQEIHAAARVLREGDFGWNLQDPVVIRGATGVANFDLSPLPAGPHHLVLIAWTPDGTAVPARAELPDLTIAPR
jgi:hypothetical protein